MSDEVKPDGPKDENARSRMQVIAQLVDEQLPRDWGFFVLVFPFNGQEGRTNYVSNAQRNDCIAAMKDWIKRAKAGQEVFRHIPDDDERKT